jgi:tRNA (guanine-N7-)-methyltransferase
MVMRRGEKPAYHGAPLDLKNADGLQVEWVPGSFMTRATADEIFPRTAPLEVDFGSGEGSFLEAMALRFPERNFLGIERMEGRVDKTCRRVVGKGLVNVRLLRIENHYAARHLLPQSGVSVAHIGFPDPWPKRYHHPRRLFQDDFMEALHGILAEQGEVRIKTDDQPYFLWIEKVIGRAAGFERLDWMEEPDYPKTDFESHFLAQGLPIYRALLRKKG